MGLFTPREHHDERELGGSGLHVDLDEKACTSCRRDLLPWQATCPDCGEPAVARRALAPLSQPPAHLLDPPPDPDPPPDQDA